MKSVADVAAIEDTMARATAAATLARQAQEKIRTLRERRDLAILVWLRPFADAVADTNAARARLREEYEAGALTHEQYEDGLAANREQRRKDLEAANVKVYPVHVYEALGVSRNLVNRMLMRMPDAPLPPMSDPGRSAKRAHEQIPQYEEVLRQAREIRDTAAIMLMDGTGEHGEHVTPVSNADVARATRLTTARVAQLRESAGAR